MVKRFLATILILGGIISIIFLVASIVIICLIAPENGEQYITAIILVFLAVVLSLIFSARKISKSAERKIHKAIKKLNLDKPLDFHEIEELSPVLVEIDKRNKKLKKQAEISDRKTTEVNYIRENVSEGIIFINHKGIVLYANKIAKRLLSCNENEFYLDYCRIMEYRTVVEKALKGEKSYLKFTVDNLIYGIKANTISRGSLGFDLCLFINDITEEENMQKMRQEFTANVSHELKTPLTSILGSAEIIQSGIAPPQDVPHFVGKIYSEAKRLLALIEDIIKLSRLDENKISAQFEKISLKTTCENVKFLLEEKASVRNVSLSVECDEDVFIMGYPVVIQEMIYNLSENAIKYNKVGGSVNISAQNSAGEVVVTISDTGIGIPKEDISRVFERFYRVDKSHCKYSNLDSEVGGTGLGLSIVKHGAQIHNATIDLESEIGIGTKIKIRFNEI